MMKPFLIFFPFSMSFFLGYLLINIIFQDDRKPDPFIHFFLSCGLGLGLSSSITFYSFIITNIFNTLLIICIHLLLIFSLLIFYLLFQKIDTYKKNKKPSSFTMKNIFLFILLAICFIPAGMQAKFYPNGGWDAWAVWNFKAKFLFLSQGEWKNLFDPILWRTSPHYPLLLPLINVWGWTFTKTPLPSVPLTTSLIFTFLTCGLLFACLRDMTKSSLTFFAPLILITLPFYNSLATSQYSDITLSYYLLASIYCLIMTIHLNKFSYAFLSGIFLGILSFSKPEGMVASILLLAIGTLQFLLFEPKKISLKTKSIPLLFLLLGTALAILPSIIFKATCSPGNQTFINGLMSESNPITFYRVKMVFAFLFMELKNGKWNGIWLVLFLGLVLSKGKCFSTKTIIIPLFLLAYLASVLFYYFLNTYFKIEWWLSVTLSRILFSLLPVMLFWVFISLWEGDKRNP